MIRKTVGLSLLLYDDFSGRCITQGGHLFKLNGHLVTPIHKQEGFYVFLDPVDPVVDVEISGGSYQTRMIRVETAKLNPLFPVVYVRMMRKLNAGYTDCEFLEGTAKPGAEIYALKSGAAANKLLSVREDEDGLAVAVSGYLTQWDSEKRFMVGTGKTKETFVTGEYLPDKSYRLRTPFKHAHKTGEPVVRCYAAICDQNGNFAIPLEKGQKEQLKEVFYYDGEGKKWVCLSLTAHS